MSSSFLVETLSAGDSRWTERQRAREREGAEDIQLCRKSDRVELERAHKGRRVVYRSHRLVAAEDKMVQPSSELRIDRIERRVSLLPV